VLNILICGGFGSERENYFPQCVIPAGKNAANEYLKSNNLFIVAVRYK